MHQGGAVAGGYAIPIVAGLVVVGAFGNIGGSFEAGVAERTDAAIPRNISVGGRSSAAIDDGSGGAVLAPMGSKGNAAGSTEVSETTGTQFAPPSSEVTRPDPPDPMTTLASKLAAEARQAARSLTQDAHRVYDSWFNEHGDALSLSAYSKRNSSFSVEFPGRLSHTVEPSFASQEPAEVTAELDRLDREAWRERPLGDKPVAAWNHGDAVSALLDDFVLAPDFVELLLGSSLPESLFGDSFFAPLKPGMTADDLTESKPRYGEIDLSQYSIRQIEHMAENGLIEPPTAQEIQGDVDRYGADVKDLKAQLDALDALEEAMDRDLSFYRDEISGALETSEDLRLLLQLEQARTAWDEENDSRSINGFALQREMAPLEAEGVMAEIRSLYQGGGEPEQSAEELLLSIVGTDLHDASVQQVLRDNEEAIQTEIAELMSELPSEEFRFGGLAITARYQAQEINAERSEVRADRKALVEQLQPLLDAHKKQHDKGELDGLDEGEWKQYQAREKEIKSLTEQINALSAQDSEITDRLNAFNGNAALLSDEYQTIEAPAKFEEMKNPGFHKERPLGGLSYPITGPRITSPYGWRTHPVHGDRRLHTGTDFVPNNGDYRILAAQRGTVVFVGDNGGFGNTIVIRHPDGSETSYSHLRSMHVREGATVDRGAHIGEMGGAKGMPGAGTSTGIHLHFEYFAPGTIPDDVTGYGASPGANYQRSSDCAGHLH